MEKNIFGTDGIRGAIGNEPFTQTSIIQLGKAIGVWAQQTYAKNTISILLGYDTRESCSWVKSALQTGLLQYNSIVYDAYTIPTPAIMQHVMSTNQFDLGIIISASHNIFSDNGIKIVDRTGKLSLDDELIISKLFYADEFNKNQYVHFGTALPYTQLQEMYYNSIISRFPANLLSNLHIVLDYGNGATHQVAKKIFTHLGATVISINDNPTGKNINDQCGALHTQSLQKAVLKYAAHVGFAFDGDGDRVIVVDRYGNIKNGDDILALLMHHPFYKNEQAIVGTIMSNCGLQIYIEGYNKRFIRTDVGDKYIAQQLIKDNLLLGGEQSGHIILRDYVQCGDGIFTALRVIESMLHTDNWDMITFQKYPQVCINIAVGIKKDLALPAFKQLIGDYQLLLHDGRLLVRYSGTEPLVRIMIEDKDLEHAKKIGHDLSKELAKQLS